MSDPRPVGGARPDPRRLRFERALRRHDFHLTDTARTLGISRQTAGAWYREWQDGTLLRRFPTEKTT